MRKLKANEIDVKVKQVGNGWALLLLYKTARVDMQMLDEEYGPLGWQSDYKTLNGVLYCGIGILDVNTKEWVWKWDCGIESRDNDGQEKKGEASDAFKRAGFKIGIGRELYTSPVIFANVETVAEKDRNGKTVYKLADHKLRFEVSDITYDKAGNITDLEIKTNKGQIVFRQNQNIGKQTSYATKAQPKQDPFRNIDMKHARAMQSAQTADELADVMAGIRQSMGDAFNDFESKYKAAYDLRLLQLVKGK